jgi:hypothetical protein
MAVVIVRPDNFIDPSGIERRIVHASDVEELIVRAVAAYQLSLPSHVLLDPKNQEVHAQIWSHPRGYNNRRQLRANESLTHDGLTLYLRIHVPTPAAAALVVFE